MLHLCNTYFKTHRVKFSLYFLLNLLLCGVKIVIPLVSGQFINLLISSGSARSLFFYVALFAFLHVVGVLIGYANNSLYIVLQTETAYLLNKDLLAHLRKLPLSYFENKDAACLTQRVNHDANTLTIFYISLYTNTIVDVLSLVATVSLLFCFHWGIAFGLLFLLLLYLLSFGLFKKGLYQCMRRLNEAQNTFFSCMNEQLYHMKFIQLHALQRDYTKKLDEEFEEVLGAAKRNQTTSYRLSSVDSVLNLLAQSFLFLYGGLTVLSGNLSVGVLTVLFSYYRSSLNSISSLLQFGKSYQTALASYRQIEEILKEPPQHSGHGTLDKITSIDVKNITFSYGSHRVLQNISCHFERGNVYGIFGENGCGKSTLIELICGLYMDSYAGEVEYNGIDMRKLDMLALRETLIGVTEQEPTLKQDTVYHNIVLYHKKAISLAEIDELCRKLNLTPFLETLPQGLDTVINEHSANLSGGEKQKISLLRQILKHPDVLVFDEPSSALDDESKERFRALLAELKQEKIILLVSHDASFQEDCDAVLSL